MLTHGRGCEAMDGRARLLAAGCIASGAILALMILSPLLSPYGAFRGLDGSPGFIDGGWEGGGPASLYHIRNSRKRVLIFS